jgi:hypothetical protein
MKGRLLQIGKKGAQLEAGLRFNTEVQIIKTAILSG